MKIGSTKMRISWHYTVGRWLPHILESGVILPATQGVPENEKPAVWFSRDQHWEETANKMSIRPDGSRQFGTKASTHAEHGGLVRIGVAPDYPLIDWLEFRQVSGIHPSSARTLARAAKLNGADPYLWKVSFEPVAQRDWVAVERWDGRCWIWDDSFLMSLVLDHASNGT